MSSLSIDRPAPRSGRLSARLVPRLAVALAVAAVLGTWLGSGVAVSVVVRWVAFEALYVVLPGCLLYLLLAPTPGGRLRTLAIGWPLGYALAVGAFALTAWLGARGALAALPLVSLILAAPLLGRASGRARLGTLLAARGKGRERGGLPELVPVALAVTAAVVLLGFTFFASSPLPERARSVAYSEDNVYDITLAAEARHHWPITLAWVAGEPLRYYTGVFIDAAAVNQVMGIPLGTIFLRLLPSTMFLIAALQLWALGRSLGRSRWVGPVAAILLLVTQDVNLDPTKSLVLQIDPFTQFPLSPTFGFGVPFFLGGLLLLQSNLVGARARGDAGGHTGTPGLLLLVGIFVAGLAAAKAFGAFDLVGGLGVYWLWRLWRGEGSRTLTYCLAVAGIAVLAIYFLMISGGGSATMTVHPLDFLRQGNTLEHATHAAKRVAGSALYWLPLLVGGGVLAVLALAPLLGAGWALWRERAASATTALLLAVFAVGMGGYTLLGAPAGVEGVFFVYGYIALLPVAAIGLVGLWQRIPPGARRASTIACGALLGLGVLVATLSASLPLTGRARDVWLVAAYGSVAGAAVLATRRLGRDYRIVFSSRPVRVVACCIPLLTALALVKPLTLTGSGAWKTIVGKPTSAPDAAAEYGMTAALYRGLLWVRGHTTACDVLAVNNHYDNAPREESLYFYYSAFTERRIFLESWQHTPGGQEGAQPYPARFALNERAIAQGDPEALRELARRGVSYVLIDKTHGGGAPEPASTSTLVYSSPALDVYRLAPVGRAGGCGVVT